MNKLITYQYGSYECKLEVGPKMPDDDLYGREFHIHSVVDSKSGIEINLYYINEDEIQAAYEAEEQEAANQRRAERCARICNNE